MTNSYSEDAPALFAYGTSDSGTAGFVDFDGAAPSFHPNSLIADVFVISFEQEHLN